MQQEPEKWGYRGDPALWSALKIQLCCKEIPKTVEELSEILETSFKEQTSFGLGLLDEVFIEKFSNGGMSSGYIHGAFWREVAFPLILKRFLDIRNM